MLEHPLDASYILRHKKKIKRELLAEQEALLTKNIAVLGGSTTSEIINILEIFLLKNGINPVFYESEYNRFYEESCFENKRLDEFKPDIVYIHTTNKNIAKYPELKASPTEVEKLLEEQTEKFKTIWSSLSRFNCVIVQNNFDYTHQRSLGNLDCYDIHGKTNFISKLNSEFAKLAKDVGNLYINDINYLSAYLGIREWFDPILWYQANML